MKILILFIILYLHIYDDYYAQGILASMKQREWWEKQYTGSIANKDKQRELYGRDYLMALRNTRLAGLLSRISHI